MQTKFNSKLLMVFVTVVSLFGLQTTSQASEPAYRWLIKPKYDHARMFSEDLWAVQKGELWGYVDSADNVVIDFQYLHAGPFRNGMASVTVGRDLSREYKNESDADMGARIDKKGQYLVPPRTRFEFLPYIYDGKNLLLGFRNQEGKYGFLDTFGNVQIPAIYDEIKTTSQNKAIVRSGDLYGIIDIEGNWFLPLRYSFENELRYFGAIRFWKEYIPFYSDGLWGLLNTKGEVVLEAKYSEIGFSLDHSGPLRVVLGEKPNSKIGYLDETFAFVVSPDRYQPHRDQPFFRNSRFNENYLGGIAFVYEAGMFKALDAKGKTAFEFSSLLAEPWNFINYNVDGYYVIRELRSGNLCIVNKSGKVLLPPVFSTICPSKEGIIAVQRDKLWGLLLIEQ